MATGQAKFAAAATITITAASLADGSARESTVIDNTSNVYVDAVIYLALKLATGSPTGNIDVYAYTGITSAKLTDNVTGSDADITLRSPTNLLKLGTINTPDSGDLTYKAVFNSAALGMRGLLPPFWGIVIDNQSGLALAASGHTAEFVGVHSESV